MSENITQQEIEKQLKDEIYNLLAAAPDMLRALKVAYQAMYMDAMLRGSGQHGSDIQVVADAIAKAENGK